MPAPRRKSSNRRTAAATRKLPVLVLNGPNLNMLGVRETKIYGKATLRDLEALCRKTAAGLKIAVDCRQSNIEGELVSWAQESRKTHSGIVINAGGYSHTSIAIRDALDIVKTPKIEVHISDIHAREAFRQTSMIEKVVDESISGKGIEGYALAIRAVAKLMHLER